MTLPPALAAGLSAELGPLADAEPQAGGSINDAWLVELADSRRLFVKTRPGARRADFEAEAAGLRWLAAAGAPVPGVIAVGADPAWLALEWVEPGPVSDAAAETLGRALADLHRSGAPAHGALPPRSPDAVLRLGSVEVALQERATWAEVYGRDLLLPLARRARDAGTLTAEGAAAVERVCERIGALLPEEPPARLHGDLWGGNVHAGTGRLWLIDPTAHGGNREMDLAMLRLFGAPSDRILSAYAEAYPLAPGSAERVALWQIQPLLVHAVLFGGGYGARAASAAAAYL